jgi:hypothetical protein
MDETAKKRLIGDASDFLGSENWYAGRGIPWKRGEQSLQSGCLFLLS